MTSAGYDVVSCQFLLKRDGMGKAFIPFDSKGRTLVRVQVPFWQYSVAGSAYSLLPRQGRIDPFTGKHLHDSAEDVWSTGEMMARSY